MKRVYQKRFIALVTIGFAFSMQLHAFNVANYATSSKLSSGHWVKISVAADGVYQITAEELAQMGFSSPENVAVYGNGGHMISERLDGTALDDLQPVQSAYSNGKLIFYGKGPVAMTYNNSSSCFDRTINAYSTLGYYFLTEADSETPLTMDVDIPHRKRFAWRGHCAESGGV